MRELVSAGKGLFVDKSGKGEREREREVIEIELWMQLNMLENRSEFAYEMLR